VVVVGVALLILMGLEGLVAQAEAVLVVLAEVGTPMELQTQVAVVVVLDHQQVQVAMVVQV
jgi:hypothetical protein